MRKILIVDDDNILANSLRKALSKLHYDAVIREGGEEALSFIKSQETDFILLDNKLPDMTGLEVLSHLKELNVKVPVVMMTAYGTEDTAIESMKLGAYDYITKPFDLKELEGIMESGFNTYRLMQNIDETIPCLEKEFCDDQRMISVSKKMQKICKMIGQIAETDLTVLIRGESGTGKELIAQSIYQHSLRKDKYFLAVNSAAIPEALLESELLGHEQGAFTGAVKRKIGKFEQCDQGTLFLDEIGDMPLPIQAKILRVLQYGEFERVGGTEKIKVDVRIIAATNKPLEEYIQKGLFREDLYYRLEAVTINVPPLRDRTEDIRPLTEYFFKKHSQKINNGVKNIHNTVFKKLESYGWPGNIRELSNTINRAVALTKGDILTDENIILGGLKLNDDHVDSSTKWINEIENKIKHAVEAELKLSEHDIMNKILLPIEKIIIYFVLEKCNWNQVQAAKILGMSRTTLREKIKFFKN
ncbi:sigma-54 dependent transcriptional regulator [Desulfobulbus sp.]|uniref:sigma-54-dependent transcriptional regulator n=1 Tax=Desulfobulbus sp. TaxID=895 RepID=UPI00286EC9AE|nr:sigma-54 dependent transcriptional regulator [Desulfobulbus sp.]